MLQSILKYIRFASVLFLLTSLSAGIIYAQAEINDKKNYDNTEVLAQVGDIQITTEEFISGYEFGQAFYKRGPDSKKKYLQYLINEKLLALKGYEQQIDSTEQASEMLNEIKNDLATEELFKEDILMHIQVSEKEIDSVVIQKQIELEIHWLYSKDAEGMNNYIRALKNNISFDSLFANQFNDSVYLDMRSLKTNRYQLGQKNPMLAGIIDTLKYGSISAPIHTDDGWYMVKLNNVWNPIITNESEIQKQRYESKEAIIKNKMDTASDNYVHELMTDANPTIKGDAFTIIRSFIGQYVLPHEKMMEWALKEKMDDVLDKYKNLEKDDYGKIPLVVYTDGEINIDKFLRWYRNRAQYIKLANTDIDAYSNSLEQIVWRMIRDELLTELAHKRGMHTKPEVVKQAGWWKDKIVFSALMNEIRNSIDIKSGEVAGGDDKISQTEIERTNALITEKLFRELQRLKAKYKVEIREQVLSAVQVSTENDLRAVEIYMVKKGGLLPRSPYPTLDTFWQYWE